MAKFLLCEDDLIMKYTTTAIVNLTSGILELSEDQARRRFHNLKALGDGRFEVLRTVQFKTGETFGYDGDIPKTLANSLIESAQAEIGTIAEPNRRKRLSNVL